MKHYFYIILLLVLPLLTAIITPRVFAATPMPTSTPTPVEYLLPYPGMLPDSPLYFFKTVRDRIIELLISDPIRKAEFYILQADKKLNMGVVLSQKGKKELAKEILSQSLAARSQAQTALANVVTSGKQVPAFVSEKLLLSLQKHKEVLSNLKLETQSLNTLFTEAKKIVEQSK